MSRPFRRVRRGKLVAGICAAVARRLRWNVWLVRGLWVILTLLPFLPGLPVYLVLWILVPREN